MDLIGGVMRGKRDRTEKARDVFKRHGGILRTREALQFGIHAEVLYRMRDQGIRVRPECCYFKGFQHGSTAI